MGTGIVTSVPSDSPDDWIALKELQVSEDIRNRYGIKEEWCIPYVPQKVVKTDEYGDLTAINLLD